MAGESTKIAPMGSALQRAQSLQPGTEVPWSALETDAYLQVKPLARLLSPEGYELKKGLWFRIQGFGLLLGLALVGVGWLIWSFPSILGVLALTQGAPAAQGPLFSADFAIPAAAAVYAWSSVAMTAHAIMLMIKGYDPKWGGWQQGGAIATFIICGVSVPWVRERGNAAGVPWETAAIIAAVAAVIAAGYFTVLTVLRARHLRWRTVGDPLPRKPFRLVSWRIARLSARRRQNIARDIAAAIDDLQSRQVITDDEAQVARQAELGALGRRMDAWRRQTEPAGSAH